MMGQIFATFAAFCSKSLFAPFCELPGSESILLNKPEIAVKMVVMQYPG